MAYQIYTPMQAVTIPTSIFSRAAERGAKAGALLDTPETAKLKGEIEGRTRSLQDQQLRESIESSNIRQERQREALESDKRDNKLAPIKEGLSIASGLIDIVDDVQELFGNSNRLKIQESQLELYNIKAETERQTASIKSNTAILVAENGRAEATRSAEDMQVSKDLSEALTANEPGRLQTLLQDPKATSFFMRNPNQAAQVYTTMSRRGLISEAELDERLATSYSQLYYKGELRANQAQTKAKQKAYDDYEKNYEALEPILPIINRYVPGKAYNRDYISKLSIIPAELYEVKDGKIDPASKPPKRVSSSIDHLLIESDTGKVITTLSDKGAEYGKLLDKFRLSYGSYTSKQAVTLDQGKLTKTSEGTLTRKLEKPEVRKMPTLGMKEISSRLNANRISKDTIDKTSKSGFTAGKNIREGSWGTRIKELYKKSVNKIAPRAIDNIPEEALGSVDTASEALASETIKLYSSASPKEREVMVENLKTKLPFFARKELEREQANKEKGYENWQDNKEVEYYFGSAGIEPLKEIYKEEIVSDLELVRERGMAKGMEDTAATPEEYKQAAASELAAAARTATNPIEASKIYKQFRDKTGENLADREPVAEINSEKITAAVTSLQGQYNFSDGKRVQMETTVTNVQLNPYLSDKPAYVKAVAAVESAGKMNQVSFTGVRGLMQVTGAVEEDFESTGLDKDIPEDNVKLGQLYLDKLFSEFGDKQLAYAAYNAGPGTVKDAIKLSGGKRTWEAIIPYMLESLKIQHKSAVMRGGATDTVRWNPLDKFYEVKDYPKNVLYYEFVFNKLY